MNIIFLKIKKQIILISFLFFILYSLVTAGTNYPFPLDRNYANGIRITSYNPSTLQTLYNTWKSRYVVTANPGQRVISPEPINGVGNRTVSEGQAYGMLLAVYFADQTLFNNLWAFKDARSQGKTTGLMPWVIENNGTTIVDPNSASDADFDIAFALLMAHYQWGSGGTYNYQNLAATEIQRCRSYDINAGTYSVRPGDAWNDWGYPSYYFPAFFRVFGEFEGGSYQTTWNNVVARCLNNINTNRNTSSGLVGEICAVDTGARRYDNPCSGGCDGNLYKYNSCRVPWRYATDWLWYGNATNSSGNEVNLLASFWNGIAPANVRDGYRISDNSVEGSVNNACFVGPAGCSLMYSSTYSSRLNEYYTRTLSFDVNESYYNGTLQVLTLLLMTGNFHNLRSFGSPEPTRTYTPVPSGQTIDCFEDGNGINDWGGEWYTYADRTTCNLTATIWPAPNTGVTPSAGGPTGSTYYLRVTGTKAAANTSSNCYPSIGFGTDLRYKITQTAEVVDLRPFYSAGGGIRFWARGNGSTIYKITLVPRGAGQTIHRDWAMYEYQFTPPSSWTQIAIPFSDFTQPTWSTETYTRDQVLQIMQKIQIQNGTNDAMTFDFSLDCIELFPYLWTPTPASTPTRTRTPTPAGTATYTMTRTPTATPTYTRTPTRTNTSAATPTWTPSRTATSTFTRTASPTSSRTPTGTNTTAATFTFTRTGTATSTYTRTVTSTYTRTSSPTEIITTIFTPTNTPSRTASPTSSRTATLTNTLIPTNTFTFTRTVSPTYTRTSSPTEIITTIFTPTNTPSRTASPTSSRTATLTNPEFYTIKNTNIHIYCYRYNIFKHTNLHSYIYFNIINNFNTHSNIYIHNDIYFHLYKYSC
jgi:endo-1,4-beta-D-glucanase Y